MVTVLLLAAAAALWGATRLDDGPGSGTGLALVALAGAGGTIAVGGWARRGVGALVALAGVLGGLQAVTAEGTGLGRWVALFGDLLLVTAGLLVIRLAATLPTMGTKYRSTNARARSGDPDKDMWDGLSQGRDPTTNGAEDER